MAEGTQTGKTQHAVAHVGHHVPVWVLAATLIVLLVLTFGTVAATWFDLGGFNLWIAMIIATIKAILVALFFMHLAYDRPFHAIVLCTTLFFVTLFIGLALLDAFQYRGNVDAFRDDMRERSPELIAPQLETERARLKQQP